jgi:D-arabinose 1-dehydrogenase-like Zn-dependent alcohol dehydrogenase
MKIGSVKTYGSFTQVGQPKGGLFTINNSNFMFSRVNYNSSLISGIPETQEVMGYCALNHIYPQIEITTIRFIRVQISGFYSMRLFTIFYCLIDTFPFEN